MFPNYQNMYAYDAHPREEMYEVDGDEEAVRALAAAAAILAEDPSKLLYFPCKKRGFWMNDDCSLVMVRPELQFRRSQWYQLKPKLDKRHWNGDIYLQKVQMCRIQICQPEYVEGIGSDWVLDEGEKENLIRLIKEESRYVPGLTNWQVLLREYRYQEEKGSRAMDVPACFVMLDYTLLPMRKEKGGQCCSRYNLNIFKISYIILMVLRENE